MLISAFTETYYGDGLSHPNRPNALQTSCDNCYFTDIVLKAYAVRIVLKIQYRFWKSRCFPFIEFIQST